MGKNLRVRVAAWITLSALFAFCGCAPIAALAGEHGDSEPSVTGKVTGQSTAVWDGSRWRVQTGTTGGAANTAEASPRGTLVYYYPAVIQNKICGGDVPDSTTAYPASGATQWYLDLYPTFRFTATNDSTAAYVVGLQVRNSTTGANDTLSVSGWFCAHTAGAVGIADSLGNLARVINNGAGPQAGKCLPTEMPLVIGNIGGGTRIYRIPLYSRDCGWWNGDNIGIRLRLVANYLSSGTANTTAANIPCVTWRADLRGYR